MMLTPEGLVFSAVWDSELLAARDSSCGKERLPYEAPQLAGSKQHRPLACLFPRNGNRT